MFYIGIIDVMASAKILNRAPNRSRGASPHYGAEHNLHDDGGMTERVDDLS